MIYDFIAYFIGDSKTGLILLFDWLFYRKLVMIVHNLNYSVENDRYCYL